MLDFRLPHPVRVALKEKRHADAVLLLTETISASKDSHEIVAALDLRCQAYTKLGKPELALQDAKAMIRESKRKAPEGYLRCAQLERLSGNCSAAIKWLEHGSKHVPRCRQIFQEQLNKIQTVADREAALRHRRDPLTTVPLEVLVMIFSYLPYREIVALLRVSKMWKGLLSKLPPLSTDIDFSNARKKVSLTACRAAHQRLGQRAQRIIVDSLAPPALKLVESWLMKNPKIESVETLHLYDKEISLDSVRFQRFGWLKSLHLSGQRKSHRHNIFDLIAACQSLREVVVRGFINSPVRELNNTNLQTQLQYLDLHCNNGSTFVIAPTCFQNYPNLETLKVSGLTLLDTNLDLRSHRRLRTLWLEVSNSSHVDLSLPESIEVFCCKASSGPNQHLVSYAITEPLCLPNLRSISVEGRWGIEIMDMLDECNKASMLEEVSLTGTWDSFWEQKADQGCTLFQDCRKLAIVCHGTQDRHWAMIAALFPNVERLTMELPMVTGVFLSGLVLREGCRLTEIALRDCTKVSHDIREWLGSKSIKCQIFTTSTDTRSLGRLIRID